MIELNSNQAKNIKRRENREWQSCVSFCSLRFISKQLNIALLTVENNLSVLKYIYPKITYSNRKPHQCFVCLNYPQV